MSTSDLMAKFSLELGRLNAAQKQAVAALEGPVLVFAGPGTGKTQVLTLRIANLIAQGMAQPEEILAITFTHAATVNMRERLVKIIGSTAHQVNFHTFHELSAQIISESGEYFPLRQAQMADDLQQLLLMEEIVATLPLVVLRPAGKKFFYVHELINAIGKLKQEAITPLAYYALMTASVKKLQQMIAQERDKKRPARGKIATWQKSIDKQKELAMVFAAYQHTLVRRGYYDYHDMIAMVVAALRQYPDLLATYQERWQYFLVDEYQDTNNAQAELLHLLASYWQAPNLFVVGDPQQAIYRFQGANLENFLLFAKQYPQVKEISLTCGYRCGQITYNLAHELILQQTQSSSRTGREVALQAASNSSEPLSIAGYSNRDAEILAVLSQVQALVKTGVDLDKIAVIYRRNNEEARWRELAEAVNLAFRSQQSINVLEQPIITAVVNLWQLLANLANRYLAEQYLWQYLWLPLEKFSQLCLLKLQALLKKNHQFLIDLLLAEKTQGLVQLEDGLSAEFITHLVDLRKKILHYQRLSLNTSINLWYQEFLRDFFFLPLPALYQQLLSLLSLYHFERTLYAWQRGKPLLLSQVLANLATMSEQQQALWMQPWQSQGKALTLTTAHKAKGLEWDYVFITGVNKNNWDKLASRQMLPLPEGILTAQTLTSAKDDNTRLLYVALTRGKKRVMLSYHLFDLALSNREKSASLYVDFLRQFPPNQVKTISPALATEEQVISQLNVLLTPAPGRSFTKQVRDYFATKVKELVISPTMLNDYLVDTNRFIERYLLEIPDYSVSVHKEFGNSCHQALEKFGKNYLATGKFATSPALVDYFVASFKGQDLSEREKNDYLEIGRQSLTAYHQQYFASGSEQILCCEKLFGWGGNLLVSGVPVCGKIDRLDVLEAKTGILRAVDYKTGRALSLNKVLSGTAIELSPREKKLPVFLRSSLKRQLLFYKLLVEAEKNFPFRVQSGVLDFIKKSSSSKPSRVEIALLDEEAAALAKLLKQVWQEIINLDFLSAATY